MKQSRLIFLLVFMAAIVVVRNADAQVYYMNVDHVKPSKVFEYDEALKEYVDFMKVNNYAYPFEIYRSEDLHYYFVTPIKSTFSELDSINIALGEVADKNPDGWGQMFNKFNDTYFSNITSCYYFASALSYMPEKQAVPDEELVCMEVWFVQVRLGEAVNLNNLFKQFNALCREKGVPFPTYVYRGLIGMEQGTYMIVSPGKNPADIWESSQKAFQMIGEEGAKINEQMIKLLDKVEVKYLWWIKQYSYTPAKK